MRVLLTGATGFIGSHAIEHYLKTTDWNLVLLEGLNYASSMRRLTEMAVWPSQQDRMTLVFHDLRASLSDDVVHQLGFVDAIIHFAAETHVDRALMDPRPFVATNVVGTLNLLEYAKTIGVRRYLQISTDEVYGPAPQSVFFKEGDSYRPSNPYSATKAGADCLAYSYFVSFGLPVIITRTMNNFGERQHPEKLIPKTMRHLLKREPVVIHGTPGAIGSRCWLHARNHADAVKFLLEKGRPGETYHISSNEERTNLEMAQRIAEIMDYPLNGNVQYVDFHQTRPGHDRRYALDGSKLKAMGWRPPVDFESSLERTIRWTMAHPEWLYV